MQALVFSAGGAFGAYQAGAWQALEERGFRPQIVVGASVGSANAAAVARGCTARQLQQWWRDPASDVFRWNWPPRVWGFLDPRPLEARLEELLREFPHVSTAAKLLVTVTELPGTRVQAIADEQVTARVLLASCAVPFAYPPVKLNGRWYTDGGIFDRLPLAVAAQAGATQIVAVDLLAAPPSRLARGLLRAATAVRRWLLRQPDLMSGPQGVRVWRVQSSQPLGGVSDILRWEAGQVDRWIEAGYRDAAALWESQASAAHPSSPTAERTAPT